MVGLFDGALGLDGDPLLDATRLEPVSSANLVSAAGVDRLVSLSADDMGQIDALIVERMQSPVAVIPALANHLIAAGGKRLRPLLCIAAARLCATDKDHHHKLAAAVEFIHTATLLHDDVVDQSALRRGKVAAHLIWGAASSVLVGDFLFARAFELMVETDSLKALGILSNASAVITEGEVLQLMKAFDLELSLEDYISIISAKTAALFAAATQSGAVSAGASDEKVQALYNYGLNLGLAFQIKDDILDYQGVSQELGKNAGDDFAEGKSTLPLIFAIEATRESHAQFWQRTIRDRKQTPDDFHEALALMHKCGALDSAFELALDYAHKAKQALSLFENDPWRQALIELADFSVHRQK